MNHLATVRPRPERNTLARRTRHSLRRLPGPVRRVLAGALQRAGLRPVENDDLHPERLAVLAQVLGDAVIEIGCGHRKTSPSFTGIDLTPGGRRGSVGNVAGRTSQADVAALGQQLPVRTGACDTLVARHNLEHYVDLVAVLREWHRVVRVGGRLVAVVPDEGRYEGRTVELDPTHYHSFDESFLAGLLPLLGWEIRQLGPCIEGWSLLVVAERVLTRDPPRSTCSGAPAGLRQRVLDDGDPPRPCAPAPVRP